MSEEQFWEIIEEIYKSPFLEEFSEEETRDLQRLFIGDYLYKGGKELILQFDNILAEKLRSLFIPKIAELFVINGYDIRIKDNYDFFYISNDGFRHFRQWIVGLGQEHYLNFLNFTKEEEILPYNIDGNIAYRGDLNLIAFNLVQEFNLDIELNYNEDGDWHELYENMIKSDFDKKYPKLFHIYQTVRHGQE
jgi:hypothetical protein